MNRSASGRSTSVNVSSLKARLAKYLRLVRSGTEVTVLDHKMPIAKIVPLDQPTVQPFDSVKPVGKFADFLKLKIPQLEIEPRVDSLTLLLEERGSR